ncbi:glycosyltransferase [Pleomorphomonas sp. JP5]|uniref:glycosyltransferase n=1 Tax=Pleomorphomonas sp. JP5 TaxID=2942998 RepID=UPI002044469C|nr:glycosyltransferase [Pleomorphomonas sp. JP5]MCM5557844.1 glycosyltransferase [Pleomorphomonas sp. JP5]
MSVETNDGLKMEGGRRPTILHISSDYLDPIRPPPITDAVVRLVDRMTDLPQVVVSLQRVVDPRRVEWRDFGDFQGRRLIVYRYFAPPFGIGMAACQFAVARRIGRFLAAERIQPDVVHTHRFTFEGIAGWLLARRFKAALFCSMRGEVERKVFRSKPTYRPLFRRIARDAARIYHVSAWYREGFERYTGVDRRKTDLLPNIVFNATAVIEPATPRPVIVCPMSLRAIDKKGLPELIAAFASVRDRLPGVRLEVIGEGPEEAQARVKALIAAQGLEGRAVLRDFMPHDALLDYLRETLAMALPSHQETFGMVYLEALFSGTPILHTLGSGIDGYLDDLDVGVGVRPGNASDIAAGLVRLVEDNATYRSRIAASSEVLYERLAPERTIARYREAVADAVRANRSGAVSDR